MERLVKKYEQRYKRARDCVARWKELQDQIVRLFGNAAAVIQRMPLLLEEGNCGALAEMEGLRNDLAARQAESLENILIEMRATLLKMENVRNMLEKLWRDGDNLLKNEKPKPTSQQLQQRVGPRPSIEDCISGLRELYIMHRDEYKLKTDIICSLTYDTKADDITALQTVLEEQPNIPPDEVQVIFDLVFAGGTT